MSAGVPRFYHNIAEEVLRGLASEFASFKFVTVTSSSRIVRVDEKAG